MQRVGLQVENNFKTKSRISTLRLKGVPQETGMLADGSKIGCVITIDLQLGLTLLYL